MLQVPAMYKNRGFNKKLSPRSPPAPTLTPPVTGTHDRVKIALGSSRGEESSGLRKQQQTSGILDPTNKENRKK